MSTSHARRRVLLAGLSAAVCSPMLRANTTFPNKPVQLIVPAPAGGSTDGVARRLGTLLEKRWGQSVVIENRPGGSGMVGLQSLMRAAPDGYTLLMPSSGGMSVLPLIHGQRFTARESLSLITFVSQYCFPLVTAPQSPFNSYAELLRYGQENPGKVSIAHAGVGATNHIAAEYLNLVARTDFLPVPYGGDSPMLTAALGQHVTLALPATASSLPMVKSGKLKAIATTGMERAEFLPEVPTLRELGANVVFRAYNIIAAPVGLPAPIAQQISKDVRDALATSDMQALFVAGGLTTEALSAQQLVQRVEADAAAYADVVRQANIKLS